MVRGGRVKTLSFGKFGFRHKLSMDKRGICQKENFRVQPEIRSAITRKSSNVASGIPLVADRPPPTTRAAMGVVGKLLGKLNAFDPKRDGFAGAVTDASEQTKLGAFSVVVLLPRGGLFSPLLRPVLLRLRRECAAAVQGDHGRDAPVREPGQSSP